MMKLQEITDLNGITQAEVIPMYANIILSGVSDKEIFRINKMIIERWSNSALVRIKDKAWKITRS